MFFSDRDASTRIKIFFPCFAYVFSVLDVMLRAAAFSTNCNAMLTRASIALQLETQIFLIRQISFRGSVPRSILSSTCLPMALISWLQVSGKISFCNITFMFMLALILASPMKANFCFWNNFKQWLSSQPTRDFVYLGYQRERIKTILIILFSEPFCFQNNYCELVQTVKHFWTQLFPQQCGFVCGDLYMLPSLHRRVKWFGQNLLCLDANLVGGFK